VARPRAVVVHRFDRPGALQAEQARWTLLAQIDTDGRAGMMWGDAGTLYWLARREGLSTDRLAPTSFIWQCY
jgi:uncharacterized protein YwqG